MSLRTGDLVVYRHFKGMLAYALVVNPPLSTLRRETEIMWMGDPTADFGEIDVISENYLELVSRAGEE